MIKKNKLSIFLLAVVAMLSVYYIKNPNNNDDITVEVVRYYQDERDEINDSRENQIISLEEIISSKDSNMADKEKAINEMALLNTMTENEITLESMIMSLGYKDCLVEVDCDNICVNISLLSESLSKEEFLEIANIVNDKYEGYKVNLNFEAI